ncbi:MAG: AAA family ATPase [Pirellulaceae bacterium]
MGYNLEVQNFRALNRSQWAPSGVCVVVGPNGSGKTTLLGVLEFLRNAFLRGPAQALNEMGGAYGLRSWTAAKDDPVLLSFAVDDLRWELQLTVDGPTVSERLGECVTLGAESVLSRAALSSRLVYRGKDHSIAEGDDRLALRIISDADSPEELAPLIRAIGNLRVYRAYNIWSLQQNGSRAGSDLHLHPSGRNAFTVLRNWRDRRELRPQYEFVLDSLQAAFPDVSEDLEFPSAGLTTTVNLFDPTWHASFPLTLAPDGWITGLLHLIAVAGAQPNTLIAIDDFGNDLHPFAIRALTASFQQWAEEHDNTVCLASHSPVLLDEFKMSPESVFVMEHDLESRPVALNELFDPDWLSRFSLGRLYQHGEFGGQTRRDQGRVRRNEDHGGT